MWEGRLRVGFVDVVDKFVTDEQTLYLLSSLSLLPPVRICTNTRLIRI